MAALFILIGVLSVSSCALSKACRKDLLENVDFPGSDITNMFSPDVHHCQHLCTQHPSCLFFSFLRADWTADKRNYHCYLKTTLSGQPKIQTHVFGITSGYSLKPCDPNPEPCLPHVYRNVDFWGADYRSLFTANYEECQRVCTEDPYCQFFTFITGVSTSVGFRYKCHLKFTWPLPRTLKVVRNSRVVTGFSHNVQFSRPSNTACSPKLFPSTNFTERPFESQSAATPEYCLALCAAHPRCSYFSFDSLSLTCHLKNNPNHIVMSAKRGVTSGIATHFCQQDSNWAKKALDGIDFYGSDIRFELTDDAETCQRKCSNDHNCQFYTYIKGADAGHRRRCYLKRVITLPAPPRVNKVANLISGFAKRNCLRNDLTVLHVH
ncbi:coagulation factor XI-like isoform X1 [Festucalex cinctus]